MTAQKTPSSLQGFSLGDKLFYKAKAALFQDVASFIYLRHHWRATDKATVGDAIQYCIISLGREGFLSAIRWVLANGARTGMRARGEIWKVFRILRGRCYTLFLY